MGARLVALGLGMAVIAGSLLMGAAPAQADETVDTGLCEVSVRDRTPGVYPGGFYVYQNCVRISAP